MDLQTKLVDAGRVYKMYSSRLEKLGITKIEDFLYHIPFRYEDYTLISPIANIQEGETVTIQGTIKEIKNEYHRNSKKIQKAVVEDDTGSIEITWFNQPFIVKTLNQGDRVSLSGKVDRFSQKLFLQSPVYELLTAHSTTIHTGRLVPIYPETYGVTSKWLRRQVFSILSKYKQNILEYLPDSILSKYNFPEIQTALETIHFPNSLEQALLASKRFSFEEFFFLQLAVIERKKAWKNREIGRSLTINTFQKEIDTFVESLPFTLTNAQQKALKEIFVDVQKVTPMNRLLEGDVGSGKTVVAAVAMYVTHLNKLQSVLMAPTEILANQHYQTITTLLTPLGIRVGLATGSKKLQQQANEFDILVGTHAILSEKITFNDLGLVVIDEQQRFGVSQRAIIRGKGNNPHVLTMTATPIPRTVALVMYGDLDLSILDEMPHGRLQIKTWLVPEQKRNAGYGWIEKEIKENSSQAFIICPFIDESENMTTVKAATKEFERLQKNVFPNLKLGLLHGRLKGKEKNAVLEKFKNKDFDILVATPVVEVGIDIANATIMLIEASERFGLAQLHQLRGRVGRGDKQSYCLLFTDSKNPQTIDRLKSMERIYNGPELAEIDMKLRGPGDMYGTMQHGIPKLKYASFSDFDLIQETKHEAEAVFEDLRKYPSLVRKLAEVTQQEISPD